ncbi:DUF2207 domain-containing protein [Agromyces larvae]|uniref:DUF2207 domain-containing protein n=1 Tax=Agromyces larvae TaxID=2929802 RepID=A0ABY4BYZ2_9MICO|nr:DUF2207 domain-containing protein [Agromyces larvae]UOE42943.1 DUF2207 domain-containing protein [Agromyces larvae]
MNSRVRDLAVRVAVGGAITLATVFAMPAAAVAAPTPASVASGVEDFTFDSFHADYELGRDDGGHSTLTTVETIVARFPDFDQNRGIVRQLVDTYRGQPTDLHVVSVTDAEGRPVPYESESEDGIVTLALGTDEFVHGVQTYVITYTQRNITRHYADTDADEFYWDVNGEHWRQPFGTVSAEVHVDDDLRAAATGGANAGVGSFGETDPVDIVTTDTGWSVTTTDVQPEATLTFAIGFEPGTFTPRDTGFFAEPWPTLSVLSALLAVAALVIAARVRSTRLRDAPGRATIVAEYLPPRGLSIPMATTVARSSRSPITAQLLQLALLGSMRVIEKPGLGGLLRAPEYVLQYVENPAPESAARRLRRPEATPDDTRALHAVFGENLVHGETRSLSAPSASIASGLQALLSSARTAAVDQGLRRKRPMGLVMLVGAMAGLGTVLALVFAITSVERDVGGGLPWIGVLAGVGSLIATIALVAKWPYEAAGAELRDHLAGLDLYIRLAEADRIRVLQSPAGAIREPIAVDDPAQVLELTERLLPWAVLLGHERRWAEVLGRAYEQAGSEPDWYVGTQPFSSVSFASSLDSISTTTTASFDSSSSSGGSGGGGVSAGGGGGGGGGGGR